MDVSISPNPATNYVDIKFYSEKNAEATMWLYDCNGKIILNIKQKVFKGNNSIQLNSLNMYGNAIYDLKIQVNENTITKKLVIRN